MKKSNSTKKISFLKHMGIDSVKLEKLLKTPEDSYLSYPIKKTDRTKLRWIDAPLGELKAMQYVALYKFLYNYAPHDCAVGFRIGLNVKEGASRHLGNKVLLTMDISNFFNSVKIQRVYQLFSGLIHRYRIKNNLKAKDLSAKEESIFMQEIHLLANLVCFKGQLPQGAPTSPAIGNLVVRPIDTQISKLADRNGLTYTRYADDLTLSHPDVDYPIGDHIAYIAEMLKHLGLQVNHKKTRILRPHRRMSVTGVVINDKLGVPKYKWRNMRARIHNLHKQNTGIYENEYQEIRGYCEWIKNLNPVRGKQLITQLGKIPLRNS